MAPGSPPTIISSSNTQNLSPASQISQNQQQFHQLNTLYDQFLTLLPGEFASSDNIHLSLSDRFADLFEQFSAYIGTFSIIQEELDSLKQIIIEKQDELEKLRTHLELTTDTLTQLQEEQSLLSKNKPYDSDEDELEEILGFQPRAPSVQSLSSITPGEKQQLIAQNELLSSLLNEKEQELIILQQAEKTREDLIKNFELLRVNLQQMEIDKEVKQVELNDIRNVLDEKLRENSSLKKEKMFFIEKLATLERERQEQQTIIQISSKQSSPDREKSPSSIKTKAIEQNVSQYV
jgi:DNA repair exonuclease SbcCD ATPase subunit